MTRKYNGIKLVDWLGKNNIYDPSYLNFAKINFVQQKVSGVLAKTQAEYEKIRNNIRVISIHRSKDYWLPVFQVKLNDGTTLILRNNFYNWIVSVNSPRDSEADFMGCFNLEEEIPAVSCEGFPVELCYGSYSKNKRQFTLKLTTDDSNYDLFVFLWVFAYYVLGKGKKI